MKPDLSPTTLSKSADTEMVKNEVVYITAAFEIPIFADKFLPGFLRAFAMKNAGKPLLVFSDRPVDQYKSILPFESVVFDLKSLMSQFDPEYYRGEQRGNIIKFELLRQASDKYPQASICWIDCDSLAIDELDRYLDSESNWFVQQGQEGSQISDIGNGVQVPFNELAIGGIFSVRREFIQTLVRLGKEIPKWQKQPVTWEGAPEQALLSHAIQERKGDVRFLNKAHSAIFNLDFCVGYYRLPRPGAPFLRELIWKDGSLHFRGRRVALLNFISRHLQRHLLEGFLSFPKPTRVWLRSIYGLESTLKDELFYRINKIRNRIALRYRYEDSPFA